MKPRPGKLYDQRKDGVVDIVGSLPGYTAGRFPLSELFGLPFMMSGPEATSKALWDYRQQYDAAEFKDVRPIDAAKALIARHSTAQRRRAGKA